MKQTLINSGTCIALFLALVGAPATVAAQSAVVDQSNTDGLFLNLRTGGYGVAFDNDDDGGEGLGLGLRLGYGFNERFTLYAGIDAAGVKGDNTFEEFAADDEFNIAFIELGGRYHFRTQERLVPFADASLTIMGVAFEKDQTTNGEEVTYGGLGGSIGGGAMYFVTPKFALEGTASFVPGNLSDRSVGNQENSVDLGMASIRMTVGISYYPFD